MKRLTCQIEAVLGRLLCHIEAIWLRLMCLIEAVWRRLICQLEAVWGKVIFLIEATWVRLMCQIKSICERLMSQIEASSYCFFQINLLETENCQNCHRGKDIQNKRYYLLISRFPNFNQSNKNLERLYIWGVVRCRLYAMVRDVQVSRFCCRDGWNVTKTEMSLKLKCQQNLNVTKT